MPNALWAAIRALRGAFADGLAVLNDDQWAQWAQWSLCGRWRIEDVLVRLTAAASTGRLRWLATTSCFGSGSGKTALKDFQMLCVTNIGSRRQ